MHHWGHYFGPDIKLARRPDRAHAAADGGHAAADGEHDADQRAELQGLMQATMQDPGLQQEMARLQQNLGQMMRPGGLATQLRVLRRRIADA